MHFDAFLVPMRALAQHWDAARSAALLPSQLLLWLMASLTGFVA
jgi:hypothetical protein